MSLTKFGDHKFVCRRVQNLQHRIYDIKGDLRLVGELKSNSVSFTYLTELPNVEVFNPLLKIYQALPKDKIKVCTSEIQLKPVIPNHGEHRLYINFCVHLQTSIMTRVYAFNFIRHQIIYQKTLLTSERFNTHLQASGLQMILNSSKVNLGFLKLSFKLNEYNCNARRQQNPSSKHYSLTKIQIKGKESENIALMQSYRV